MAHVKLDGGFMSLPINIKRGNPIPLDTTSVHYPTFNANGEVSVSAFNNARNYAENNVVAYVGQIITVCEGVLENGAFKVSNSDNSGVYYIADEAGTLVKLVNNEVYNDDKKEDLEIDYSKLIQNTNKDDGTFVSTIIIAPKSYKYGTSDLFINGIKYNNTEYTEITYTDGGGVETGSETCNAILFEAFAVVDGDEVTIMADYE
jgi:hypothetical protein